MTHHHHPKTTIPSHEQTCGMVVDIPAKQSYSEIARDKLIRSETLIHFENSNESHELK